MVNRADCDDVYSEDVVQLRNKVQYSEQVQSLLKGTITTRDCGIKSSCLLNTLQYFHVVENSTVDILHDVLEGVAEFELKLIFHSFVYVKKYFSLALLNSRLSSFDYGYLHRNSKPAAISETELKDQQKTGLSQKASELHCLHFL